MASQAFVIMGLHTAWYCLAELHLSEKGLQRLWGAVVSDDFMLDPIRLSILRGNHCEHDVLPAGYQPNGTAGLIRWGHNGGGGGQSDDDFCTSTRPPSAGASSPLLRLCLALR